MTIEDMDNELSEGREGLPEGWVEVELGQLGIWGSGGTPPRTNPAFYADVGIPWLVMGDLNDRIVYDARNHITESGLRSSAAKLLNPGTLLVAMYGSIGKLGITGIQCATNQAIAFCVPHEEVTALNFLYYTLKNEQQALIAQGQGGAQQNISQSILKAHPIPLPPLPEQIRIADKLDALLARVDAGRERLERVPKLIKQLRQAVLSAAVSGELTREWRGGGEAEWEEASGTGVFSFVTSGSRGWAEHYSESGSIFLRIGNLNHGNISLDLSNIQYVNPPSGAEGTRTRVRVNDILISITADVGMIAHVDSDLGEAYINQHICLARPKPGNLPKFLAYFLTAPNGGLSHLRNIQRGATKAGLTLGDIRETAFQLPPLPEQAEIVRRVEALFSLADRLEGRYQSALSSFERLTPALLAKAFRGELVPQDPEDEPAAVLLERIRAQKAAGGGQKTRGRQTRTAGESGTEPKRRGRPPKAQAEGAEGTAEPKRRGRPPGARAIPTALNEEEAIRLLQERGQKRAEGSRLVGLFEESEAPS